MLSTHILRAAAGPRIFATPGPGFDWGGPYPSADCDEDLEEPGRIRRVLTDIYRWITLDDGD